jgi:pyruvate dehydrogenase E2 component (dihydrolipoamide acetyltransferase)/2-oxoisovalerate dehydrogenase E2 component (dihydrolipoyl transacylase)
MEFSLPPVGEGLFEVELVRWLVQPGDTVKRGQPLAEVMSDKATMEVPAPFAGTITATAAEPGTKVKVGQLFLTYDTEGTGSNVSRESTSRDEAKEPGPMPAADVAGEPAPAAVAVLEHQGNGHSSARLPAAAPSVRHLARKFNIDLAKVRGTGPAGRILLDDLAPFLKPGRPGAATAPPAAPLPGPESIRLELGTPGTKVKLAGIRRKIAEKMVASTRTIPHYSYIDECDLTDLVKLRTQLREPFAKAGVKLTYLAFFVKAATRALKDVPVVNSTFDEATEEVICHDHYHIGIAVAAPTGLIVPIIKDADRRDLAGIAAEIERLSADARAGKSRLEDLRGGTFTITSIGNIGGLISTPIINHPEVGIMGVGKVTKRPVYDAAGNLKAADVVFLSFSFDHRIVDGAVGAAFGNAVLKHLQAPATLLLPEKLR